MSKSLDPTLIKKYFRNQKPPKLKALEAEGKKFTDPYFPPDYHCLTGQDEKGNSIDYEGAIDGIENLEACFPGITKGQSKNTEFRRISDMKGKWKVFEGKIEMDDIIQGNIGDCYFLTAISALSNYPYLINEKFRTIEYSELGYYEIILFIDGEWQVVFVDDYFPVYKSSTQFLFATPHNNELWVILLEKAWAKVNGGYALIEGGMIDEAFLALTGFPSEYISHDGLEPQELFEKILESSKENIVMGCGSLGETDKETVDGIVCSHAYTLSQAKLYKDPVEDIELIQVRNPWGQTEWEGPWSDNSSLWTPKLREYFNCVANDDGIFWIDYNNYASRFFETTISYILYGSIIKAITIEKESLFQTPLVFNIALEAPGKLSINSLLKIRRFNRELGEVFYPIYMVLAKYNDSRAVEKLYAKGSTSSDISIIQDLPKGNYFLWVYIDYKHTTNTKNMKYTVRIAGTSNYRVEYMGKDENCEALEYVLLSYTKKCNSSYKNCDDFYQGEEPELKRNGIYAKIFINKTENQTLFAKYMLTSSTVNVLKKTKTDIIEIPPKMGTVIIATNFVRSRGNVTFRSKFRSKPCKCPTKEDTSHINALLSLDIKEENTEQRGLSINAYKQVDKDKLHDMISFGGLSQMEEQDQKKAQEELEEKKRLEIENEKREAEAKKKLIEEAKRKEEERKKREEMKRKEEEERKKQEEIERLKREKELERQQEEMKRQEEENRRKEEEARKRLEEIKKEKEEAERKKQEDAIKKAEEMERRIKMEEENRKKREMEQKLIYEKELKRQEEENEKRRKYEEEMQRLKEENEKKQKEENEKRRKREQERLEREAAEAKNKQSKEEEAQLKQKEKVSQESTVIPIPERKIIKDIDNLIAENFEDEVTFLNENYPEKSPYCDVPREWVIIDIQGGEYVGEVKVGTSIAQGRGMFFYDETDYVHYSYFDNGVVEYQKTMKIIDMDMVTFKGFITHGKKQGHGEIVYQFDEETNKKIEYFEGNFDNDEMEGEGVMHYANGSMWKGNYTKGKKNGISIFINKDYYALQKFENGDFIKEIPITKSEYENCTDLVALYNSKLQSKIEVIKALDVLPEETEEEKSKREYFETLTSLMQDHPLMMHVYLRLYQSSKANDTFKITKKEEEGTIYIGELNEQGRFNGKGVMMNGSMMYAGFWSNGLPSGFFYVFKNGVLEYKGTFNNYKKDGTATLYENGYVSYKGEVVNGKENGYGIKTMRRKGEFFQGEFKDGMYKEAKGKYYFMKGLVYKDVNIINDVISQDDIVIQPFNKTLTKEGLTFLESMKGKYSDFVNRLRLVIPRQFSKHVELKWGTLTTKEGDVFIGQMNNGDPYGIGGLIYKNNNNVAYYIGYIKHWLPDERGTFYNKEWKVIYTGGFEYGKKTGYGIEYNDSETYYGNFTADLRNGQGVIVSDDVLFEGAFINGKKHGQGYIINKNDKTITPVKFNQGNIESEDAIIKCSIVSKSKRKTQKSNLPPQYQKYITLFHNLPYDESDEIYLDIIYREEQGATYIGEVNSALMKHGRGVLIDHFYQTYYVGYFRYDMKEGNGAIYTTYGDATLYEGNFHLGKPLGKGTYYFYEPRLYQIEGDFNEIGEGEGKEIYIDTYWKGKFYAWLKDGEGEEVDLNGEILRKKSYVLNQEE